MGLPKVTANDLKRLCFDRFAAVFGFYGAGAYKDNPVLVAQEWLKVLQWRYPEEITRGVDAWMGQKDKWPTPGQLYHAILESQPQKAYGEMVEEGSDWFAFPVGDGDVEGPRYRQMPLSQAHSLGMSLVEHTTCPDHGCGCCAVEVWLTPKSMGLPDRIKSRTIAWAFAHPRGWKWAHYATEHSMNPCSRTSAETVR